MQTFPNIKTQSVKWFLNQIKIEKIFTEKRTKEMELFVGAADELSEFS